MVGRLFSTSIQPAGKRKAKTAYKGGRTKHLRSAARAELKAVRAVSRAVSGGKLSDDNGKSDMEETTNVDKEVNKDEDYIEQEYYTQMTETEQMATVPS